MPNVSTSKVSPNGRGARSEAATETYPLPALFSALQAMKNGDFSVRMNSTDTGLEGKIADVFNEIVAANQQMADQLRRVGQSVGREGKTKQRVKFGLAGGSWGDMESSVNGLIDDLLWPTTEVTRAVTAVARGEDRKSTSLNSSHIVISYALFCLAI